LLSSPTGYSDVEILLQEAVFNPGLKVFLAACLVYTISTTWLYRHHPNPEWRDCMLLLFSFLGYFAAVFAALEAQMIAFAVLPWVGVTALTLSLHGRTSHFDD